MASDFHLEMAGESHAGLVRSHNEDSISWDLSLGLALLADGLGGHNAGEVAAGMATRVIVSEARQRLGSATSIGPGDRNARVEPAALLAQLMENANAAIYEAAAVENAYAGMGTTLVAALFHGAQVTIAHVGDSRCYRLRRGALTQLTTDHTALTWARGGLRKVLTQALGTEPRVRPAIAEHALAPEDVYLLCSDGLTDGLDDNEIASVIVHGAGDRQGSCSRLIEKANEAGGLDNVSVILVAVADRR